jgi:hypothetical protein
MRLTSSRRYCDGKLATYVSVVTSGDPVSCMTNGDVSVNFLDV